jgi:hypothetical protein
MWRVASANAIMTACAQPAKGLGVSKPEDLSGARTRSPLSSTQIARRVSQHGIGVDDLMISATTDLSARKSATFGGAAAPRDFWGAMLRQGARWQ